MGQAANEFFFTKQKQYKRDLRLQDIFKSSKRKLNEGEECQYWPKASAFIEKLALLERIPGTAINRAARTLLDLWETWENSTKEDPRILFIS